MKLSILLILGFFVISAKGQSGQSEIPFKGANRIVFVCKDSTDNLYKRLGQHLISKGYSIEADKDFLSINTKYREISRYNMTFRINSMINENKVFFTMVVYAEVLKTTVDWYYKKRETFKVVHDDFMSSMEGFEKVSVYYEEY